MAMGRGDAKTQQIALPRGGSRITFVRSSAVLGEAHYLKIMVSRAAFKNDRQPQTREPMLGGDRKNSSMAYTSSVGYWTKEDKIRSDIYNTTVFKMCTRGKPGRRGPGRGEVCDRNSVRSPKIN